MPRELKLCLQCAVTDNKITQKLLICHWRIYVSVKMYVFAHPLFFKPAYELSTILHKITNNTS